MAEDVGLSFAPVLKIDLGAVLGGDGARRFSSATFRSDRAQWLASFLSWDLTLRSLLAGRCNSVVRKATGIYKEDVYGDPSFREDTPSRRFVNRGNGTAP